MKTLTTHLHEALKIGSKTKMSEDFLQGIKLSDYDIKSSEIYGDIRRFFNAYGSWEEVRWQVNDIFKHIDGRNDLEFAKVTEKDDKWKVFDICQRAEREKTAKKIGYVVQDLPFGDDIFMKAYILDGHIIFMYVDYNDDDIEVWVSEKREKQVRTTLSQFLKEALKIRSDSDIVIRQKTRKEMIKDLIDLGKRNGLKVVFRDKKTNAGDFTIFIYDKRKQTRYLVGYDGYWSDKSSFEEYVKDAEEFINNY